MRPQVVAHRGASHDVAEHTLAAYVAALDAGADGLECDVRLTADGHLVCVHDRTLRRTASTRGVVSTMQLDDLSELDFATWKTPWAEMDDEAPEVDDDLGRVLTLRRLLEAAADYDRRVEVAIETKHPTRYGGLVERRLVDLLGDFGWTGAGSPVRVMSFSFTALQRMERLAPEVRLVQLVDKPGHWVGLQHAIGLRWELGPNIHALSASERFARAIASSPRKKHVWVVNDTKQLHLALSVGADYIISDRPAEMLKAIAE